MFLSSLAVIDIIGGDVILFTCDIIAIGGDNVVITDDDVTAIIGDHCCYP